MFNSSVARLLYIGEMNFVCWENLTLFGIISRLVYLGGLALDKGSDSLAKVLALVLSNSQLLLAGLTGTITVTIILPLEHAMNPFQCIHLRNGTSTISRATNNFRVVKEMLHDKRKN